MKIVRFLHKAYSLLFYKWVRYAFVLDSYFDEKPDMEWVINKALFALCFLQMTWLFTLLLIVEIVSGKAIPNPIDSQLMSATLLVGVLSIFNYFTLIYKKKWFKYDEEFEAYSKTKNRIISITIFLLYILSFSLLVLVFIIWGNLGDTGKIEGFGVI